MRRWTRAWAFGVCLGFGPALAAAAGCGTEPASGSVDAADAAEDGEDDAKTPDVDEDTLASDADAEGDAGDAGDGSDGGPTPSAERCDPLVPTVCALPWPSNLYLEPDPARATGYTLSFADSLPVNLDGDRVDPAPWRRMDGYGLGTPIMAHFPNLDATGLPDELAIGASLDADAAILLFEVGEDGLTRVPYFAELDQREADPARRVLFVRPAIILKEATRYVVAFRELRDADGQAFAPSEAFVRLRGGDTEGEPLLAERQARFDEVFGLLEAAGVETDALQLTWDFVTASSDALHGDILHMRDEAQALVGEDGPELTVTEVVSYLAEDDGSGAPVNPDVALMIRGTFRVPEYMVPDEGQYASGWRTSRGEDGLPEPAGWREPTFTVRIPHSALDGTPHGLVQYGHGLLGGQGEVEAGYNGKIANAHDLIFFACDWTGMSGADVPLVASALVEMSHFRWVGDRLHQGVLEFLLLQRAMRQRLPQLPELTDRGVVVDQDELFYSGISQGGIFGGTVVALSTDLTRGHLGVPGNNYATLLHRSHDFEASLTLMNLRYPDRADQTILIALAQLLWDATDPVSYYRRLKADPLPGTPSHDVIVAPAKGDYQVSVMTNEILARTDVGIPLMAHYGADVWGLTEQPYPHQGSGVVLYDFGNPWPPPGNIPPEDDLGDPHEKPRRADHHQQQMVHFFRTGEIIDVCGGDGCTPD